MSTQSTTPQTPEQQNNHFETFGFVVLRGAFKNDVDVITSEFEKVFTDKGIAHDATKRTCMVPFIDQRERLCALLDDTRITSVLDNFLGEDWNYMSSDGNYYTGDTGWHSDGFYKIGLYAKIAFYLDPVTRDSGCLRVIPGSHRLDPNADMNGQWAALRSANSLKLWGIEGRDVPCVPLESQPGDMVIFNHNMHHAAFGGNTRRRMFTINVGRKSQTPEEIEQLKNYIGGSARFWVDSLYSDIMRQTATPQRLKHLQQVSDNEGHLPALAAKMRLEMSEPSRG